MSTFLNVENIEVYYGAIHAIRGVSFHVNEGEVVTLIGANGAGKSTILKTVSGLLRPKSGSISFDGTDITQIPPHKLIPMGLAHVPEGRRIFQQMTVEEISKWVRSHSRKRVCRRIWKRYLNCFRA